MDVMKVMLHHVCGGEGLSYSSWLCGSDLSVSHMYLKMWIAHTFGDLLK